MHAPRDPMLTHYAQASEDSRLADGAGALELARTQEILLRHLPPPPRQVLDIGGGPGVYAAWLTKLGYRVQLLDPVPKHVEQAAAICPAQVGDARRLPFADASADAVLLLGPLYHLTERADRLAALSEARRVLRPGGLLFAAGISHFASLMDGVLRGLIDDPAFQAILSRDLDDGQHRNPTSNLQYFTDAYFHRPAELRHEIQESGFEDAEIFAVEGPVVVAPDFAARWQDPARRAQLLDLVRRVEREPEIIGASMHLLAVAGR